MSFDKLLRGIDRMIDAVDKQDQKLTQIQDTMDECVVLISEGSRTPNHKLIHGRGDHITVNRAGSD